MEYRQNCSNRVLYKYRILKEENEKYLHDTIPQIPFFVDSDNDNIHDSTCNCGYCEEYSLEIKNPNTLKLGQDLTVMDYHSHGDSITCVKLK